MTDTPDKRYENGYRISERALKIWNRIIFSIMGVGLLGLTIVLIVMGVKYGDADANDIPTIYYTILWACGAVAVGIPVILGAIVGGLAIHRLAWIPLLLAMLGMITAGVSRVDGLGYLGFYALIAIVVGVIGTFLIAIFRTQVDIWLGLPVLGSPRWYMRRDGKNEIKSGNAATPVFPDEVNKDKQDK